MNEHIVRTVSRGRAWGFSLLTMMLVITAIAVALGAYKSIEPIIDLQHAIDSSGHLSDSDKETLSHILWSSQSVRLFENLRAPPKGPFFTLAWKGQLDNSDVVMVFHHENGTGFSKLPGASFPTVIIVCDEQGQLLRWRRGPKGKVVSVSMPKVQAGKESITIETLRRVLKTESMVIQLDDGVDPSEWASD